jgi:hypothetical protein
MSKIPFQKQNLIDLRNECLFNSFVMFESVRQIKKSNERKRTISYLINMVVVIFTLTTIFLAQTKLEVLGINHSNTFIGLLAFGFSIAIFLFRPDGDTRIDYTIANSYWLLYRRVQDILYIVDDKNTFQNEIEIIKAEKNSLTRLAPTFKTEKVKNAVKYIKKGYFLYHSEEEIKLIKEHFEKIH